MAPRVAAAVSGAFVLALIILILLFQWNWLRGPLAHLLSDRLNRPVSITGNLEVHPWSWSPRATINGLVIGEPKWAAGPPMARLPRVTLRVKLLPLLVGRLELPLLQVEHPDVRLIRDASGRTNWNFAGPGASRPAKPPAIAHLIITDGALRYDDARRRFTFAGSMSTEETAALHTGSFRLEGDGAVNAVPFHALLTGGPLINVDPKRPYDFSVRIDNGDTKLAASGRLAHPFQFGQLSGRLNVSGSDFARLYDISGLAFPNSPPYALASDFARDGARYRFSALSGRVGESDLAGNLAVDDTSGRPFLSAALTSRRVRLIDLAAVLGGGPRHTAGKLVSPLQKAMAARLTAEHRMLPDAHLDATRLRAMDANVTYSAASVEAGKVPIRALSATISLDHGLLNVRPLAVDFPIGGLTGWVQLDGRPATPHTTIDLRLTNARLETLIPPGRGPPSIEGAIYGRATLSGVGDSVRAAAASANGRVTLIVPDGQMRQAFAELLGIDATKGLFLLIAKNHGQTPIRCGIADFQAQGGILTGRTLILDTGVVLATGQGDIDLRDEDLNLSVSGKPKKFRLVRIGAPITLKGSLESPKVGVDIAKAAPQVAGAVALGVVLAPVAAVLPFVHPGLAKDADCASLEANLPAGGRSAVAAIRR